MDDDDSDARLSQAALKSLVCLAPTFLGVYGLTLSSVVLPADTVVALQNAAWPLLKVPLMFLLYILIEETLSPPLERVTERFARPAAVFVAVALNVWVANFAPDDALVVLPGVAVAWWYHRYGRPLRAGPTSGRTR